MEFINELWEANKMTESALLDLKIDESAVNAFDAEGSVDMKWKFWKVNWELVWY